MCSIPDVAQTSTSQTIAGRGRLPMPLLCRMWTTATACWPGLQTVNTDRLQRILNATAWHVSGTLQVWPGYVISAEHDLCYGSTLQTVSTTNWTLLLLCITACMRKLAEVNGRLLPTSFESQKPSTTTLSQSTPYCAALLVIKHNKRRTDASRLCAI